MSFPGGGTVICKRPILRVERGDCLAHLATDFAAERWRPRSPRAVALTLCAVEVLAMAGTMTFQALIPTFIGEWRLSHAEAGWISGAAYAGYMAGVPLLVSLTDRIDARRMVILFALVACLSSLGFALLADGRLERGRCSARSTAWRSPAPTCRASRR